MIHHPAPARAFSHLSKAKERSPSKSGYASNPLGAGMTNTAGQQAKQQQSMW
jgi:hypothetical protein